VVDKLPFANFKMIINRYLITEQIAKGLIRRRAWYAASDQAYAICCLWAS